MGKKHGAVTATVEAVEALLPWNLKPVLDGQRRDRTASALEALPG